MIERLDALTVRDHNDKSYWTKIGAAFPSKSGGWIVRLDAVPASVDGQYTIHLREPLPRDDAQRSVRNDRNDARARARDDDDLPGWN